MRCYVFYVHFYTSSMYSTKFLYTYNVYSIRSCVRSCYNAAHNCIKQDGKDSVDQPQQQNIYLPVFARCQIFKRKKKITNPNKKQKRKQKKRRRRSGTTLSLCVNCQLHSKFRSSLWQWPVAVLFCFRLDSTCVTWQKKRNNSIDLMPGDNDNE